MSCAAASSSIRAFRLPLAGLSLSSSSNGIELHALGPLTGGCLKCCHGYSSISAAAGPAAFCHEKVSRKSLVGVQQKKPSEKLSFLPRSRQRSISSPAPWRRSELNARGDSEQQPRVKARLVVGDKREVGQSSVDDELVNFDWSRPEGGKFPPTRIIAPGRRVVAVGDLHGDWEQTVMALQIAGVLNSKGNCWIGGSTILVQLGDILDRGDDEIRIMSLLSNLHEQARSYGGAVYQVNGNHETMNVAEDFRYVTDRGMQEAYEFKRFTRIEFGGDGAAAFEAWWEASRFWKPKTPAPSAGFAHLLSPGISWNPIEIQKRQRARAALFAPGGVLARVMARHGVALQVNDTLFAHGGVLPHHVEYGLERMNQQVSRWMRGDTPEEVPFAATKGYNSVVWSRLYSQEDFASCDDVRKACVVLRMALEAAGAERLVVGHTPQMIGANSQCNGRVWRIDVGMSKGILHAPPQVLEIIDDRVQVLQSGQHEDASFLTYV